MSRPVAVVRPARREDLDDLVRLWAQLREIGRDGGTARLARGTAASVAGAAHDRLAEMLATDGCHLVVAELEGHVVGMAMLCETRIGQLLDLPAVQLTHVVVDDAHRRRGVGRQLIASAVTLADDIGAEEVVVSVYPGLREANRFYARLGFAPLVVRRVAPVSALRRRLAATDVRTTTAVRRRRVPARSALSLRARIAHVEETAVEPL